MLTYTYVDNSNVFIEGQRASAVAKGLAPDIVTATTQHTFDHSWNLDYGKLHTLLCGDKSEIGAAKLWGSPPPGDSFWKMVERKGFDVTTFDRSKQGKEKKVDVAIAHQMTKDAYSGVIAKTDTEIILVAGDKDYMPVVEDLVAAGFSITVAFWDHAARELKDACSSFFSLNQYVGHLEF